MLPQHVIVRSCVGVQQCLFGISYVSAGTVLYGGLFVFVSAGIVLYAGPLVCACGALHGERCTGSAWVFGIAGWDYGT